MRTYTNRSRTVTLKDLVSRLDDFIDTADTHKNCYFWTSPASAAARRAKEFSTDISFQFNGVQYDLSQSLDCSCKHVYFRQSVTVNSENKDIRAVKKVLRDIAAIIKKRA